VSLGRWSPYLLEFLPLSASGFRSVCSPNCSPNARLPGNATDFTPRYQRAHKTTAAGASPQNALRSRVIGSPTGSPGGHGQRCLAARGRAAARHLVGIAPSTISLRATVEAPKRRRKSRPSSNDRYRAAPPTRAPRSTPLRQRQPNSVWARSRNGRGATCVATTALVSLQTDQASARPDTQFDALSNEVAILAVATPNSSRNRSNSRTARGPSS
jgi:hypothetical protein